MWLAGAAGLAAQEGTEVAEDAAPSEPPAYVGTPACVECHVTEYEAWTGSHHDLAWTEPTEGNILGDFNNATRGDYGLLRFEKNRWRSRSVGIPATGLRRRGSNPESGDPLA